ncbi:hypothetical protein DGWBC_0431 [Dehalogenimonas sp. WBC-2]|nr:hypothetical protein DGWBC_0431 [Dehalogenimonas sp. WBC-2]
MDSGNYEAFWLRDRDWDLKTFEKAVSQIKPDLTLAFDNPWSHTGGNGSLDLNIPNCLPIVHGNPTNLPKQVLAAAQSYKDTPLIAVAERELGDGIVQRATTLCSIVKNIEGEGLKHGIHLLGTGNPRSILLYAACGAISFDGLEWCQTAVDQRDGTLLHFSQRELTGCECAACNTSGSYSAVTLGHNLLFYIDWMQKIQSSINTGSVGDMLTNYFPTKLLERIRI